MKIPLNKKFKIDKISGRKGKNVYQPSSNLNPSTPKGDPDKTKKALNNAKYNKTPSNPTEVSQYKNAVKNMSKSGGGSDKVAKPAKPTKKKKLK